MNSYAALLSGILLLFAPASHSQAQKTTAPLLRVICLPARPLALVVASEQKLFDKYRIEVQSEVATSSDALRGGLAADRFDLAHAAVDNGVALAAQSGADIIVVLGGEGSTNELITQPNVTSIAALRNQTLIVDAPTTAYAIQLKKILLLNGLKADADYQLKVIGGTPLRLAAMREHKEYAASILGPPASLIAKHEGFVSLGSTNKWLGPYQGIGGFTHRKWANANCDLLTSYISAFIEAQRWILEPSHKSQVLALLSREYKLSEDLAMETYDAWVVAPGGLQPDARVDAIGFLNVLKLRAEMEETWKGRALAIDQFYDSTFYERAIESVENKH
jgi:ABC-type nitrate/sulfonate/bicarbonate transport system substrate-binding protein